MPRLLFTVWPYPTHLHPFIALALEARSRGHDIAFYTGGGALSALAREGFRCFPFREVDWGRVARTVDDLIAGRKRPSQMRRLWPRFLVETVPAQLRDLEAVLAGWPADALVCDIAMWAPILILRERIPVVAFSHVAHCILPGPYGPIQGIALPRHRRGWTALYAGLASHAANLVTARTRSRANALRRQFGLAPLGMSVNEFTGALPLYLVPSAPEFDNRRRDLPPAVRYIGPCLWDKHRDQAPPDWLAQIPRHQPVVVVDEGALFTHEPRVLQMAARGLAFIWSPARLNSTIAGAIFRLRYATWGRASGIRTGTRRRPIGWPRFPGISPSWWSTRARCSRTSRACCRWPPADWPVCR